MRPATNSVNLERRAATLERAPGAVERPEGIHPEGAIERSRRLLPFGQERSVQLNSSEVSYNLNFTNKELDRDLELNYFGARYYHPELPRFISPDPVSGKPEIPLSWNRYLYCKNDPMNLLDPDGEFGLPAWLTGVAATGAAYANSKGIKSAVVSGTVGFVAGGFDTKDGNFNVVNAIKGGVASGVGGYITGFGGTVPGRKAESISCATGSAVSTILYNSLNGSNPFSDKGKADITFAVSTGAAVGLANNELASATITGALSTGYNLASNLKDLVADFAKKYALSIDQAIESTGLETLDNAYEEPSDTAE